MAFVAYRPTVLHLTAAQSQGLIRGATFLATFTVKVAGVVQNMSEYAGGGSPTPPKCDFKTAVGGTTTNCPQPTMTWLDGGTGGQFTMEISAADTGSNSALSGKYDIEVTHSSGKKCRIFMGDWDNPLDEVTTS